MANILIPRAHAVLLLPVIKSESYLVQRPCRVTGHGKVGVQRKVHDILGSGPNVGGGLDLAEALAHKEDAVYEQAVGVALDFEVAEEGVGPEQRQGLIQDIVALRLGVGRLVGREGRVREGERVGGPAGLGAQGQEGKVPDQPWRIWVGVENGIVGLEGEMGSWLVSLTRPCLFGGS